MGDITIYPGLTQGTDEWHAARCGMITASVMGRLITPSLRVADNDTSRGIALTLAAERITGHVEDGYLGRDMWRGIEDEPYARDAYARQYAPVTEVGLIVRDLSGFRLGYSPDGLVGDDGLIEIKSRDPKIHLRAIIENLVPVENMAQLQTGLLVSGRDWIDYVSHCGGLPLWVIRVTPSREWFDAIRAALDSTEDAIDRAIGHYSLLTNGLPLTDRIDHDAEIEF